MRRFALVPAFLFLVSPTPQQGGVPKDVRGFSGQVTGIVTSKHDDGTFSFKVSRVTRVWKNNEASNLEWFHGRTIRIGPRWFKGDDGKWQRRELHVRFIRRLVDREDYRLEIDHAERDRFAILELTDEQRKLARRGDRQARRRRLPAGARLFSGLVGGIVKAKHDDGTFSFRVAKVHRVWKSSKARKPESLVGKTVRVGPRWVKGDDGKWHPYRLHVAFIRRLDDGEDYRIEIQNAELDHFHILELSAEQREWARRRR